jgi:MFS family permease
MSSNLLDRPISRVDTLPTKAILMLVSMLTVMAGATIAPSLPAMRNFFAATPDADYWVRLALTLPALFIALGAPLVGILIDKLGRKPILVTALILYGLAGSSGFVLDHLGHILVGRALLGVSVAGIMTTATTLIADYYTGTTRAQFLGLQSGFMGLGGVIFLTLGGFLADVSWRFPFLIYLLALVLVPGVLFFLPEPPRAEPAGRVGQPSEPQELPLNLVIMTYSIALVTQIVFYLIPVQLPFYLQRLFQANAAVAGLSIALATLFSAISSILYRRIKARLTFVAIYGIAFANLAIGYAFIALGSSFGLILLGLAIAGSGLGLLMPNMINCLTSVTPNALRGRVVSGVTTAVFLGQFLSPLVSQPLIKTLGLGDTYGVAALLMLGLAVAATIVLRRWK